MTTVEKATALFGGRTIDKVILEDGTPGEPILVRQIPIRDYERGVKLVEDDVALVGFLMGKDAEAAKALSPETFEEVLAVGQEVNAKGFFAFAQRRSDREKRQQAEMVRMMSNLSPEVIKLAAEKGSALQMSSPQLRRPAV